MPDCVPKIPAIEAAAPSVRPPAYRFTSGIRPLTGVANWKSGIRWRPNPCYEARRWNWFDNCEDCPGDQAEKDVSAPEVGFAEAWPFSFYVPDDCCDTLSSSRGERDARRRQALAMSIERQLAYQLHTGSGRDCDPTPTLMNTAEDISGGACVDAASGIAALMQARTIVAGQSYGSIFAPDAAIPALLQQDLIDPGSGSYVGPGGFPVVVGPGLPNTAPDGTPAAAGEAWLYIAGGVDFIVDNQFVDLDPTDWALIRTNQDPAISETDALVRLDPCGVFAVCISTKACGCC